MEDREAWKIVPVSQNRHLHIAAHCLFFTLVFVLKWPEVDLPSDTKGLNLIYIGHSLRPQAHFHRQNSGICYFASCFISLQVHLLSWNWWSHPS